MYKKISQDPRSIRAREMIQKSFFELLNEKPYSKITVKDIVEHAGLARPTFYSHYETKRHLCSSLVDDVLDVFFEDIGDWNSLSGDPESEKRIGIAFFKLWQQHTEVLQLLHSIDLDCLLLDRFKSYFKKYYNKQEMENTAGLEPALANYIINLNAYVFVGLLRRWEEDHMKYSPEVIGQLLFHFINPTLKNAAFVKFKDNFT